MQKFIIKINSYAESKLQEFESFLISIQGLNLSKFIFGLENREGKLAYTVSCKKSDADLVCTLIKSSFLGAEVIQVKDKFMSKCDFYFKLKNLDLFPIKRFDQFEEKVLKNSIDPIETLLQTFSSFDGARLELTFKNFNNSSRKNISKVWNLIFFSRFFYIDKFLFSFFSSFWASLFCFFSGSVFESEVSKYHLNESSTDSAIDKFSKNLVWVSIGYSSKSKFKLFKGAVTAYMNKFSLPYANSFKICRNHKYNLMSSEEIVSFFHFPIEDKFANIYKLDFLKIPYVLCSENRGVEVSSHGNKLYLSDENRSKHTYVLGKTGMGKSTFLKSLIKQDIERGKGVFVMDPHGDLVEDCLRFIPKNRINDLVYLDPADFKNPFLFNPLDVENEFAQNILADNLVLVFKKIFGYSWGPRLEYFLKNALLLLVENRGVSLLCLPRVFTDDLYLEELLKNCKNYFLVQFFRKEFLALNYKSRMEIVSPILNKVGPLLMDPVLRNIFGSVKTKIDLSHCVDSEKIVLVNLSKGKIGSINSNFLGSIIVSVLQTNILQRSYIEMSLRKDCFMYIDEFQNFATESFAEILAESRKYKLNLILANQYFEQVSEELQTAILGNVANIVCFQLSFDDAEKAFFQFNEKIPIKSFVDIPRLNAYGQFALENSKVFCSLDLTNMNHIEQGKVCAERLKLISKQRYNSSKKSVNWRLKKWIQV